MVWFCSLRISSSEEPGKAAKPQMHLNSNHKWGRHLLRSLEKDCGLLRMLRWTLDVSKPCGASHDFLGVLAIEN